VETLAFKVRGYHRDQVALHHHSSHVSRALPVDPTRADPLPTHRSAIELLNPRAENVRRNQAFQINVGRNSSSCAVPR
jgi:hypothetical protein